MAYERVMQALGLVRVSEKQNFIEILFDKFLECKKMGFGLKCKNICRNTL